MNYLNLDKEKTQNTVNELNILLADYHLYYQKLRNFHWNIVGKNFFNLHEKFEVMYDDAKMKVDEIAESESKLSDTKMIDILLDDHGKIIKQMRKTVNVADDNGDEGTIDLLGAYIGELEKTSWMLDAWRMKTNDTHPTA